MKVLHYEFGGWLGDAILECFPCVIVTQAAADALVNSRSTGFFVADLKTSVSPAFTEIYLKRELPLFKWLKVNGTPGKDDFGIADDLRLVVSDSALELLRPFGLNNAIIESFS